MAGVILNVQDVRFIIRKCNTVQRLRRTRPSRVHLSADWTCPYACVCSKKRNVFSEFMPPLVEGKLFSRVSVDMYHHVHVGTVHLLQASAQHHASV